MPDTVIVLIWSGMFGFALVNAAPVHVDHVERAGTVERERPLVPFASVPETDAVGTVEYAESNCRVSRPSAWGRRNRLEGVRSRVDMDQNPYSRSQGRPSDPTHT